MNRARLNRCCVAALMLAAECLAAAGPQLRVPFFSQNQNGCGAASVAMVMRYWMEQQPDSVAAAPSPQEVYEALYRPEQKGIRLADMKRFLQERGFRAFTLRGEWTDVEEHLAKGRPLIAGLKDGPRKPLHFVVLTGAGSRFVWLSDPTRKKPGRIARGEFEKRWEAAERWILLAAPPGRR